MLLSLRPPSDERVQGAVDVDARAALTYEGVGATVHGDVPAGYRVDRQVADLGVDDGDRFERCGRAVLAWAAQLGAGMRIVPSEPVALDRTFGLVLPLPIGFAVATARVVHVADDAEQIGFAYGTLPAHPEAGEELFLVRRGDGRVRFEVTAFSRPRDPLARLGGPVTRWLQVRTTSAYLDALQRIGASSGGSAPATFDRQPTLRSDRLVVRPMVEDDFEALRAIAADPLLWEQHPAKERATPEGFRLWMDDAIGSRGALTVCDASSGEVVGTSRYKWRDDELEIGWTFVARSHWGDGTNAELKRLMLDHAFAAVDHVIFRVHEHNWRSRAAVRKLGAVHVRDEGEAVVFRLERP